MAKVTEDNCVGCEDCMGSRCEYYNLQTYYTCDDCKESDVELYWDGDKMYCADCLARKHFEDFVEYCKDAMFEEFAMDYADENFESVNQED